MGTKEEKEYFPVGGILLLLGLLILAGLIGWFLFNPQSVFEVVNRFPPVGGFTILGVAFLAAMWIAVAGTIILLFEEKIW